MAQNFNTSVLGCW